MKTVLAIGNPEEKYAKTRHNIGWMVADALAEAWEAKFRKDGFEFWSAKGRLGRAPAMAVKTWTYVNQTGRVVPELKSRDAGLGPDDFIVVCDDIALPVGAIRIRAKGSSGGHNGLKSVEAALGSNEYARMRLGVGGPGAAADPDYVLGRFGTKDMGVVEKTVTTAVEALKCWAADGVEKAMTRFNRVEPQEE
ncbi:MAG TPA: aminoacyl-tRNA hydrolase [Planctomycetota bacterium]|nr:aminoacyl-tRNA hydrolase [Planctomycetota bacterium]